jgi:hypothetical protein
MPFYGLAMPLLQRRRNYRLGQQRQSGSEIDLVVAVRVSAYKSCCRCGGVGIAVLVSIDPPAVAVCVMNFLSMLWVLKDNLHRHYRDVRAAVGGGGLDWPTSHALTCLVVERPDGRGRGDRS